jgi:EmrB/QacA subfamily drug resistance transporter
MHVTTMRPESVERRRWWILGVLAFSVLVIVLDNSVLNVALPAIVRQLHASSSELQWMVDAYSLAFAGLLLTMGSLGDKYGRRPALQIGFLVFGVGSAISAIVGSPGQLIASRAVMGVGAALIMPATLSIITNVFPADERPKAIAIWTATAGVGVALGPITGGFLLEHFYWGSIFLVNLPIVAVGLLAGAFLIPDSRDPRAPRLDWVGAILSIVGLCALLYAVIEAPTHGWTNGTILTAFAIGGVVLTAFFAWEAHVEQPMLDLHFWANPRFSAASGAIAVTFFALFGAVFLLTQYLQFVLGLSALQTGVRLLASAVPVMLVSPLAPRLVARIGTKLTVAAGLATIAVALASFDGVDVTTGFGGVTWRLALLGVGMGLTMAPATESIMGSVPLARAGVGSAVNDTTRELGGAVGVAVIGSVFASVYGSRIVDALHGQPGAPSRVRRARSGPRWRLRPACRALRVAPSPRSRGSPSSTASTPPCSSPRPQRSPVSSRSSRSCRPDPAGPRSSARPRSSPPTGSASSRERHAMRQSPGVLFKGEINEQATAT